MRVPDDAPELCPVCGDAYDSVSEHADGLAVNLLDNERYRRVCFDPALVAGSARIRFYHHTHGQASGDEGGDPTPTADPVAPGTAARPDDEDA